jgi:hypothetical protein
MQIHCFGGIRVRNYSLISKQQKYKEVAKLWEIWCTVEVKSSLVFIKHIMNASGAVDYTQLFLDLSTRLKWPDSFAPRASLSKGKDPRYLLVRRLSGLKKAGLATEAKKKYRPVHSRFKLLV